MWMEIASLLGEWGEERCQRDIEKEGEHSLACFLRSFSLIPLPLMPYRMIGDNVLELGEVVSA